MTAVCGGYSKGLNSRVPNQKRSIVCHRVGRHIPGSLLAERSRYTVSFPQSNERLECGCPESRSVLSTDTRREK